MTYDEDRDAEDKGLLDPEPEPECPACGGEHIVAHAVPGTRGADYRWGPCPECSCPAEPDDDVPTYQRFFY